MKAVILAGGKGTRLAPYTTILPKPLMPIGGRPILEIILRQLRHFGFSEVVCACGHLAELIQAYISRNSIASELDIRFVVEEHPLGTAGALRQIGGLDETFLVMNGDVLTDIDYGELVRYHNEKQAALTVSTTQKRIPIGLGVVSLDNDQAIIGYDEKPVKVFPSSMGIYVFEPGALEFIDPGTSMDFPDLVLRLIDANRKVMAFPSDAFWLDIGNRSDFERAEEVFERIRPRLHMDETPKD